MLGGWGWGGSPTRFDYIYNPLWPYNAYKNLTPPLYHTHCVLLPPHSVHDVPPMLWLPRQSCAPRSPCNARKVWSKQYPVAARCAGKVAGAMWSNLSVDARPPQLPSPPGPPRSVESRPTQVPGPAAVHPTRPYTFGLLDYRFLPITAIAQPSAQSPTVRIVECCCTEFNYGVFLFEQTLFEQSQS